MNSCWLELDSRDVLDPHDGGGGIGDARAKPCLLASVDGGWDLDDDVLELLGLRETTERGDGDLEDLTDGHRGPPIGPEVTCAFWCAIAFWTSIAVSPNASSFSGSTQTRMLYGPAPKIVTCPTPGSRASGTLQVDDRVVLRNVSSNRSSSP